MVSLSIGEAFAVPAPVLVVHDDAETRDVALAALRSAGLEAVALADPMVALDAIEADSRVRVLVTSTTFPAGKPNGVALGRMLKAKRHPLKVAFIASLEEDQPLRKGWERHSPWRLIVSAQLTAHSKLRRDGTEKVSTINEVDTTDERALKPIET
jgi:CheY-like chemotaxis protein